MNRLDIEFTPYNLMFFYYLVENSFILSLKLYFKLYKIQA